MPQKTRRQKIEAAQRRFKLVERIIDNNYVYGKSANRKEELNNGVVNNSIDDPLYLRRDIFKIIAICLIIIAIQIWLRLTLS